MSNTPPTMRGCQYPGKIVMNGAACGCWKNCYSLTQRVKAFLKLTKLPERSMIE